MSGNTNYIGSYLQFAHIPFPILLAVVFYYLDASFKTNLHTNSPPYAIIHQTDFKF